MTQDLLMCVLGAEALVDPRILRSTAEDAIRLAIEVYSMLFFSGYASHELRGVTDLEWPPGQEQN